MALCPEVLPSQCRDVDQGCYGAGAGSESARHARRHAGDLGRRIRPHDLLARQADRRPITAATIIRAASACGWRAAASKAASCTARRTSSRYNIVRDPVHVRDLQATMLHQFGIDHERFTYKYQGLDQKLTGVEKASVVKQILA